MNTPKGERIAKVVARAAFVRAVKPNAILSRAVSPLTAEY